MLWSSLLNSNGKWTVLVQHFSSLVDLSKRFNSPIHWHSTSESDSMHSYTHMKATWASGLLQLQHAARGSQTTDPPLSYRHPCIWSEYGSKCCCHKTNTESLTTLSSALFLFGAAARSQTAPLLNIPASSYHTPPQGTGGHFSLSCCHLIKVIVADFLYLLLMTRCISAAVKSRLILGVN